jgi:hypothetical protein
MPPLSVTEECIEIVRHRADRAQGSPPGSTSE